MENQKRTLFNSLDNLREKANRLNSLDNRLNEILFKLKHANYDPREASLKVNDGLTCSEEPSMDLNEMFGEINGRLENSIESINEKLHFLENFIG